MNTDKRKNLRRSRPICIKKGKIHMAQFDKIVFLLQFILLLVLVAFALAV